MYLDHVVHFIGQKPEQALKYWHSLKFPAAAGGRHEKWGTFNALLYLKDCYIEWLAVEKEGVAAAAGHPLTQQLLYNKKGFGTICLRTDSIAALNDGLLRDGFATSGILDAERRAADGNRIKWKMLFIQEEVSDQLPSPFFIEWQENDAARYGNLRKSGAIQPLNEELAIEKCVFGVHDVEASKEKWKKLLGGRLELANCRIDFRQTGQQKERLEEVHFEGGSQKAEFENGVYFVPRLQY